MQHDAVHKALVIASVMTVSAQYLGKYFQLLFLLRSAALGSWRLLLLLRPRGARWLRLTARGGLQLLLLLRR